MAEVVTASGQRRRGLRTGGRALEGEHMSPPLEWKFTESGDMSCLLCRGLLRNGDLKGTSSVSGQLVKRSKALERGMQRPQTQDRAEWDRKNRVAGLRVQKLLPGRQRRLVACFCPLSASCPVLGILSKPSVNPF